MYKNFKQRKIRFSHKLLITAKLLGEEIYKQERMEVIAALETQNRLQSREVVLIKKLITYLDDFNVENYLIDTPWLSKTNNKKTKTSPSLEIHQIAMLACSRPYSINELQTTKGLLSSIKIFDETNGKEVMRMTYDLQDTYISFLNNAKSLICFLDNILAFEKIDMKKLSKDGTAMLFFIDQDAEGAQLEFYKNGERLIHCSTYNEVFIEKKIHDDMDLKSDDLELIIEETFENVTGQKILDIKQNQIVKRYLVN